jgi:hypothetical protein
LLVTSSIIPPSPIIAKRKQISLIFHISNLNLIRWSDCHRSGCGGVGGGLTCIQDVKSTLIQIYRGLM